jgi:hypothetical protein
MANTFIELNDTPSDYLGQGLKFVRVGGTSDRLIFVNPVIDDLDDVQATDAYQPLGGQALIYSSAAGKWRPGTIDVYSAGNGLSKSALTLNVVAGTGGGLTSNSSGVFITDIADVAGVYGNASHTPIITVNSKGQVTGVTTAVITATQAQTITNSFVGNVIGTAGQIRVVGGTGNNSNATIDLVATGVTAATYGNTTHLPRITVDTYGRIQNVDLIEVTGGSGSGGSGTSLGFGNIIVAGQTTVSADQASDDLTLVAGSGISITTQANSDTIIISTSSSNIASNISLGALSDVNTTGITNNQILKWNSANSSFEPFTLTDSGIVYSDLSAGTGLSYNNSTGVFRLANTSVNAGIYGNATLVPQITVDAQGRITNLTNVSIATGVTPGTYGNAINIPQFTVDATGRIISASNISAASYIQSLSWNSDTSNLTISGGNSVDLSALKNKNAFSVMRVGSDSASADQNDDVFTFAAGSGISLSLNTSTDTLTISATGGGGGSGGIALTDLSVTSTAASGNGSLSYNNSAGVFTFAPTAPQTLSMSGNVITISRGNTVDITSALASVAGNYSNSNVAAYLSTNSYATQTYVNTANTNMKTYVDAGLANAAGNYGNSNVAAYLSTNSYATQTYVNNQITGLINGANATLDTLNELAIALGNDSNFAATITSSLAGKANTNALATVAFTGSYANLTNKPVIALSGSNLSLDGTTLDLSGVGAKGDKGDTGNTGVSVSSGVVNVGGNLILTLSNASTVDVGNVRGTNGTNGTNGVDGVGVSTASVVGSNLIITLSNSITVDAGNVRGAQGPQGLAGDGNAGIANATVAGNNNLIIGLVNGTYINAGNVQGAQGSAGTNGVGITGVTLVSSNLVLTYSNTSTQDIGNIRGPQGDAGTNGTSISTATVNGSGNLIITLSNSSTVDAGNVRGAAGADGAAGIQLSNLSVTTASASGNGSLAYNNTTGVFTFTPPDLSSTGDITSVTAGTGLSGGGSSGAVTVSLGTSGVTAGTYGNATTMPQFTVDTYGRITGVSNIAISAGGGGSGDIEGVTAGAGLTDGGTTGTVTLNVGAGAGITVNADSVALTGNIITTGAKTYGSATLIPQITVDTYGRVTSVSNVSVSGGGGGGSGATIQRFKLNYSTTGALASTANLSAGISSVTIDSASGGEVTVNFTGYYYPPGSIMLYGYDRTNNKYLISHLETTMGQREVPGGGSAGSPTAFDGATSNTVIKLKLREAETGASRAFGTTTHAWIQFVMYD